MHKSRQFCSVCKDWLEMEVVPTGDGEDDDGVIWFRCPQCQGFLPKLSGGDAESEAGDDGASDSDTGRDAAPRESVAAEAEADDDDLLLPDAVEDTPDASVDGDDDSADDSAEDAVAEDAEPIAEYAAMLAAVDVDNPAPYRPWDTYEIGQCVTHLAWDDCGVVVGKEDLPGGRKIVKVFFAEAGVVRLIEQAPK